MTFDELIQQYASQGMTKPIVLPGVNAIPGTMGATPISSVGGGEGVGGVSNVGPIGSVSNASGLGNVDTSAKGIASLAASGLLGGPFGLAANIVGQMMGLPSISDVVSQAMNAMGMGATGVDTGGGFAPSPGDTGGPGGEVDSQAQSEASMSEGMSDVGDSSGGVDSAGDGGDGYAYGGRVNYLQGGLVSLLR